MAMSTSTITLRPLPKRPMVCIQSLGPDVLAQRMAHPVEGFFGLGIILRCRPGSGGLEAIGDLLEVEIEVVGHEGADFGVFVVAV